MRRLIAIFLLVLLPLQAVWAAMEPYCLHESLQSQSHHFGHHEHRHTHQHHADADANVDGAHHDDRASEPSHEPSNEPGKASAMLDHDHHCCSGASMLPAAVRVPGPLPEADGVASPLPTYASFEASRIERPNWPGSL